MSFWDRFRSRPHAPPAVPQSFVSLAVFTAPEQRLIVDETAPLRAVGAANGPTVAEALGLLRRLRGTQSETAAIEAALAASDPPPEIRVACAEVLSDRGDESRALDVIAGLATTEALSMSADLFAAKGDLPRAISAIERVLARQIDAPGARERHARWAETLGVARRPTRKTDEVTVLNAASSAGPYKILREVARGGAGTVYEAEDAALGRRVAFKVYHGQGSDRAVIEREIRVMERFRGAGVARAFDAAPSDGWVALEWAPRGSIRDVLRGGNVDQLLPIAAWAGSLARALARVHQLGWVHADVKPANVLLRGNGETLLIDFGIARTFGESSSGGSPGYLSPERLAGERASALDDVYGFGRIVEDVAQAAQRAAKPDPKATYWEQIIRICLGPASHRPMDGAQLATLTK